MIRSPRGSLLRSLKDAEPHHSSWNSIQCVSVKGFQFLWWQGRILQWHEEMVCCIDGRCQAKGRQLAAGHWLIFYGICRFALTNASLVVTAIIEDGESKQATGCCSIPNGGTHTSSARAVCRTHRSTNEFFASHNTLSSMTSSHPAVEARFYFKTRS